MLKIGEFALLAQISIRMLRHYDEIGLLRPAHVDPGTGYRYYLPEQLPRLNRILALKDLGLSLDEVRYLLLNADLSADELRGMLMLKQAQLRQHLREEQARLRRVESRLHFIEDEGRLPEIEIVLKAQPALHVLALRGSGYPGHLFREAYAALQRHGLTAQIRGMLTLYHSALEFQRTGKYPPENAVEIAFIVNEAVQQPVYLPDQRELRAKDLPGVVQAASIISTKPDHERHRDAQMLWQWMAQHQYRLAAPTRELYLQRAHNTKSFVTELLFPLEPLEQE